ncbi:MAG: hypothetical protein GX072_10670 [Lysinibacillus sp.]|nr:hypothetical protein [Lysinibacillus sp.]
MKKENHFLYNSGKKLFEEIIYEFTPEILIIEGTKAFDEFREVYKDRLINKVDIFDTGSVKELEKHRVIAEFPLHSGNVKVLVCRNMSYFGKEGSTFVHLREALSQLLK